MTVVVLRLRDDDLAEGRLVGRIEVIRPGGSDPESGAVRQMGDIEALLFGGIAVSGAPTGEVEPQRTVAVR